MLSKKARLSNKLQRLKEINDIFELYGEKLTNMDPDQLKILKLEFSEILEKLTEKQKIPEKTRKLFRGK